MPKLYIATERQREGRFSKTGVSLISPNIGSAFNRINAGQIRGGLRPVATESLDRVDRSKVYDSINKFAEITAKAAEAIADTKATLAAETNRRELAAFTNNILYEADQALFKKSGKDFVDSAKGVKQAIQKKHAELAKNLESAAAFKFYDLTTSPLESIYTSIARAEVRALEDAKQAAASRIVSDTGLLISKAAAEDIPGIVQTQAAAFVKASGIVDPNAQVVALREFQEKAFTSSVKQLMSSGKTTEEQMANIDKAETVLQFMVQTPGINKLTVDSLYKSIYDTRNILFKQSLQEEFDVARLNDLAQSQFRIAEETNIFNARTLGRDANGRTVSEILKDIKEDPRLDGRTKQSLIDFANAPTTNEPTDPAFLASTISLAMRSGSLYADNAELFDRLEHISNPKDRMRVYSVLTSARNSNIKSTIERVYADIDRAYYMAMGIKNPTEFQKQQAEQVTGYVKSKIADTLARAANTYTPDNKPVDIPPLASALMHKYIPEILAGVEPDEPTMTDLARVPKKIRKFVERLDSTSFSSYEEGYSKFSSLSWGRTPANREEARRMFMLKTKIDSYVRYKLKSRFEEPLNSKVILDLLGYN